MSTDKAFSVAIITKNEEMRLPSCLQSLSGIKDIVVVDSGSTDRTVAIAREVGCRIFVEPWKGFGPQKNSAIQKCLNEWVLVLDADERLPAEAREVIARSVAEPKATAYRLRRKNHLHQKWIRHAGYWPDWQVRVVNRTRGSYQSAIHEQWVTGGPIADIDAWLDHYGFGGYSDMLVTMNEYSTIIARELHRAGRRATILSPLYHGIGMFLKIYILQRGILEGMDGVVIALTKAGGSFFKYAKLLELQGREGPMNGG